MQSIKKIFPVRVNEIVRSYDRKYFELNGEWEFQLDIQKTGESCGWNAGTTKFDDTICVPGCLEAQGKGVNYSEVTQPGWAGTSDVPYFGVSWYKKTFSIPEDFGEKVVRLDFGGISTDCRIWLNEEFIGEHHYAAVPFGFDVTTVIKPGAENTLVVMVENNHTYATTSPEGTHGFGSSTMEIRWSGIYRGVELVATENTWIEDIYIKPDAQNGKVECNYEIAGSRTSDGSSLMLETRILPWGDVCEPIINHTRVDNGEKGKIVLDIKDPHLWTDEDPYLYKIEVRLLDENNTVIDSLVERFGLRNIAFDGSHILLNGAPVYLRGEMTHYHWPETISPTTDRDDLRKKLIMYKKYGFNFLRHHTFFPGVEYLEVCDELGLLCHNELGVVSNAWVIPQGHEEVMWQALIKRDRNHPSVIIWCMGNEIYHRSTNEDLPNGEQLKRYAGLTFGLDTTRLLQSNSPGFFVMPDGTKYKAPIHHELRKAGASYIDTSLKHLYKGAFRPWRMLWAEERTREAGLFNYLPQFTRNTQLLQARSRKTILEEMRLNADSVLDEYYLTEIDYQGYELCTFRDSGSFVWGIVDDYFNPKIVPPEELKKYNNSTALLWTYKWWNRVFGRGSTMKFVPVSIKCSHYGKKPVKNASLTWEIKDADNQVIGSGCRENININCGETVRIADDRWYFQAIDRAVKMKLYTKLAGENICIENDWDFWCFPKEIMPEPETPVYAYDLEWDLKEYVRKTYPYIKISGQEIEREALLISGRVNNILLKHLENGGRALLVGRSNFKGEVTEWGAGRSEFPRGTIIANHPLMERIPHEGWCDIPFAGMISGMVELNGRVRNEFGYVMGLRGWPEELEPIIMGIPSYKQANPQKLAHLFELAVGKGRLMITSLDFGSFHARNAATNYFFDELLRYLHSEQFNPGVKIELDFLKKISEYN